MGHGVRQCGETSSTANHKGVTHEPIHANYALLILSVRCADSLPTSYKLSIYKYIYDIIDHCSCSDDRSQSHMNSEQNKINIDVTEQ